VTECPECPNPAACDKAGLCAYEAMQYDPDDEPWCEECHNLGTIECLCGGDICVCLNYGEVPCPACGGGA
jgi:hypothetical protein